MNMKPLEGLGVLSLEQFADGPHRAGIVLRILARKLGLTLLLLAVELHLALALLVEMFFVALLLLLPLLLHALLLLPLSLQVLLVPVVIVVRPGGSRQDQSHHTCRHIRQ